MAAASQGRPNLPRLDDLPTELLEQVAGELPEHPHDVLKLSHTSKILRERLARTVCKRFWSRIAIDFTTDSLLRLYNISQVKEYAPHVEEVLVFTLHFDPLRSLPDTEDGVSLALLKEYERLSTDQMVARTAKALPLLSAALNELVNLRSICLFDDLSMLDASIAYPSRKLRQIMVALLHTGDNEAYMESRDYRGHARRVAAVVLQAAEQSASIVKLSTRFAGRGSYLTSNASKYLYGGSRLQKGIPTLKRVSLDIREGKLKHSMLAQVLAATHLEDVELNFWTTLTQQSLLIKTLNKVNLEHVRSMALSNLYLPAHDLMQTLARLPAVVMLKLENIQLSIQTAEHGSATAWPMVLRTILSKKEVLRHLHIIRPLSDEGIMSFVPLNDATSTAFSSGFERSRPSLAHDLKDAQARQRYHSMFNEESYPGCDVPIRFTQWSSVTYSERPSKGDWMCLHSAAEIEHFLPLFIANCYIAHASTSRLLHMRNFQGEPHIYSLAKPHDAALESEDDSW